MRWRSTSRCRKARLRAFTLSSCATTFVHSGLFMRLNGTRQMWFGIGLPAAVEPHVSAGHLYLQTALSLGEYTTSSSYR